MYLLLGSTHFVCGQNWQLIQPAYPSSDAFVAGYSVNDFGATGDGTTDVTGIFQGRIDALASLGGGTLFIPKGKYVLRGTLILKKGVVLRGEWQKPTKGQAINGTILMAYAGRGNETSAAFITMEPSSAVQDLVIWYPEQYPANIAIYPPAILLGEQNYFGNDYCNVKNITLVNAYSGIIFSRQNMGSCPVINGIYGTPLSRGVEIDNIADVGRIENIHFSPAYWEGSGLPNAPGTGHSFEKWLFSNGTGVIMRRNDWSYMCFVSVEGYRTGLHVAPSVASPGAFANGHNYGMTFTNCNTGIFFEAVSDVGIMYARIKISQCNNGITIGPGVKYPVQLHTCSISALQNALTTDAASGVNLMMQNCTISHGKTILSGGTITASNCEFNDNTKEVTIGANARCSLTGNQFADAGLFQNNSLYKGYVDNAPLTVPALPEYADTLPKKQKPSRMVFYNAANAPYNAKNDGITDNTTAIQSALNTASSEGGGIVFLPPGKYKVLGTLTVPSGVELKGAVDVSTAPMGPGSVLEIYSGKGNESGTPFLKLSSGSGLRGIVLDYPEQLGDNVPNFIPYPYAIQVTGDNVYIINVGLRGAYNGIDLFTNTCNNHYLDYVAGQILKTGVKVGANSTGGNISNLQFNPVGYVYGYESKWGGWSNSPSPSNINNVVNYIKDNMKFMILGNCSNESLYNDFHYGSQSGLILSGASGISLGLGIDGSRKSLVMESTGSSGFDFINSQIVAIDNLSGTCYIETQSGNSGQTSFFNSDYWGWTEYGIVQAGGELNFQMANFQYPGSTGFANITGGDILLQNSAVKSVNQLLNSGMESHFSAESSVLDPSGINDSNCALWENNLSNSIEISPGKMISRSGWTATASDNNAIAGNGIDDDINTRWDTGKNQSNGMWFAVDMKSVKTFNKIILDVSTSLNDSPVAYNVFVSNDGVNWGNAIASGTGSIGTTNINFPVQNARYIKINQTSASNNFWWSIHEFYVINNPVGEPVTGISVTPSFAKMAVNATLPLITSISPDNAANRAVSWTSDNPAVATVNTNGLVTAVSAGSAVITATTQDGEATANTYVSVSVAVTGITLDPASLQLKVDSTQQLTATIAPANTTFKSVIWSSDNPLIVSVDDNGMVKALAAGSATIVATSLDGNVNGTCLVSVTANITGFTVYAYQPDGWSAPLKIYWWGANPADSLATGVWPGITMGYWVDNTTGWYKYNFPNILSTNLIFNDGNGHQTVDLSRNSDGWFLNNTWYDSDPSKVTGIIINPDSVTISLGANHQLSVMVSPNYALNRNVTWNSDNPSVAAVNGSGMVTGVSVGFATITATSTDGEKKATSRIYVKSVLGLENPKSSGTDFEISPNPAIYETNILYHMLKQSDTQIRIYNNQGGLVSAGIYKLDAGNNKLRINISGLASGLYFVKIQSEKVVFTGKLIVK